MPVMKYLKDASQILRNLLEADGIYIQIHWNIVFQDFPSSKNGL